MHPEHQDGKAHKNIADMLPCGVFAAVQRDARNRDKRGQRRGGENAAQAAAALNIAQAEDPARNTGAQNRAENDVDGPRSRRKTESLP